MGMVAQRILEFRLHTVEVTLVFTFSIRGVEAGIHRANGRWFKYQTVALLLEQRSGRITRESSHKIC
jgi:hypothetical protein